MFSAVNLCMAEVVVIADVRQHVNIEVLKSITFSSFSNTVQDVNTEQETNKESVF